MTTERPQYPLHIVRAVAESTLADLPPTGEITTKDAWYWIGKLRDSLQQMVDATAGEGEGK